MGARIRGLTQGLIESDGFSDGVVVPFAGRAPDMARPAPNDPVANPGVQSVELQGAPPRIGLADVPFGIWRGWSVRRSRRQRVR